MSFLYRAALTITRRQPYLDWANSLGDGGPELTEELARDRRTIYLVPESTAEPDLEKLLAEFWARIFEEELSAWKLDDPEVWPAERTRTLFDTWFAAEVTNAVFDLIPDEPLTQAEVDADELGYTMSHCAWCDIELESTEPRFVGFTLPDRESYALFQGRVVAFSVDDERDLWGFMPEAGSEAAGGGDDVVVIICSSWCEKGVRKAIPKVLRKLRARSS
jgi:hypothetical protein